MATLVVQISRGMAPSRCIAEVAQAAHMRTMQYRLVHGLGAVEAKNEAVRLAMEYCDDLILVEDDAIISFDAWTAVVRALEDSAGSPSGVVATVDAVCRNGQPSVRRDTRGRFEFAGTVLVAVPFSVLSRLEPPYFAAADFKRIGGVMAFCGHNERGQGSDVWFWRRLLSLDPPPEVRVIGRVATVATPWNTGSYDLTKPIKMEVIE